MFHSSGQQPPSTLKLEAYHKYLTSFAHSAMSSLKKIEQQFTQAIYSTDDRIHPFYSKKGVLGSVKTLLSSYELLTMYAKDCFDMIEIPDFGNYLTRMVAQINTVMAWLIKKYEIEDRRTLLPPTDELILEESRAKLFKQKTKIPKQESIHISLIIDPKQSDAICSQCGHGKNSVSFLGANQLYKIKDDTNKLIKDLEKDMDKLTMELTYSNMARMKDEEKAIENKVSTQRASMSSEIFDEALKAVSKRPTEIICRNEADFMLSEINWLEETNYFDKVRGELDSTNKDRIMEAKNKLCAALNQKLGHKLKPDAPKAQRGCQTDPEREGGKVSHYQAHSKNNHHQDSKLKKQLQQQRIKVSQLKILLEQKKNGDDQEVLGLRSEVYQLKMKVNSLLQHKNNQMPHPSETLYNSPLKNSNQILSARIATDPEVPAPTPSINFRRVTRNPRQTNPILLDNYVVSTNANGINRYSDCLPQRDISYAVRKPECKLERQTVIQEVTATTVYRFPSLIRQNYQNLEVQTQNNQDTLNSKAFVHDLESSNVNGIFDDKTLKCPRRRCTIGSPPISGETNLEHGKGKGCWEPIGMNEMQVSQRQVKLLENMKVPISNVVFDSQAKKHSRKEYRLSVCPKQDQELSSINCLSTNELNTIFLSKDHAFSFERVSLLIPTSNAVSRSVRPMTSTVRNKSVQQGPLKTKNTKNLSLFGSQGTKIVNSSTNLKLLDNAITNEDGNRNPFIGHLLRHFERLYNVNRNLYHQVLLALRYPHATIYNGLNQSAIQGLIQPAANYSPGSTLASTGLNWTNGHNQLASKLKVSESKLTSHELSCIVNRLIRLHQSCEPVSQTLDDNQHSRHQENSSTVGRCEHLESLWRRIGFNF